MSKCRLCIFLKATEGRIKSRVETVFSVTDFPQLSSLHRVPEGAHTSLPEVEFYLVIIQDYGATGAREARFAYL